MWQKRDKTLSVAVPEIGQNLHELDWQFLPFRSFFNIFRWGAERASYPNIIQSPADGLSCLSLGAPLWCPEHYRGRSPQAEGVRQ